MYLVRLVAIVMLVGTSLGLLPGLGDLLVECIHADESHESTEHFCGGHCPDCGQQMQAPAVLPDNSVQNLTPLVEVQFSILVELELPAGFSARLDRPPAA